MSAARTDRWVFHDAEWAVGKRKIDGEYQVVHTVGGVMVSSVGFRLRREALAAAWQAWMAASHEPLFLVDENGTFPINEEVQVSRGPGQEA